MLSQAKESGIDISDETQMKNFIELYKKHQTGELYLSNEPTHLGASADKVNHLSSSADKEQSRNINNKYWATSTQGSNGKVQSKVVLSGLGGF